MSGLRLFPDPALRIPAREVTVFDEPGDTTLSDLVYRMCEVTVNGYGIGLAAPQLGHAMRLIVLRDMDPPKGGKAGHSPFFAFVNPRITKFSEEKDSELEGCLSLPGLQVEVERPFAIQVEAVDIFGQPMSVPLVGQDARVVQHEIDHLDGRLIVDYLDRGLWFNRMIEYRTVLLRQGLYDRHAWGQQPVVEKNAGVGPSPLSIETVRAWSHEMLPETDPYIGQV